MVTASDCYTSCHHFAAFILVTAKRQQPMQVPQNPDPQGQAVAGGLDETNVHLSLLNPFVLHLLFLLMQYQFLFGVYTTLVIGCEVIRGTW